MLSPAIQPILTIARPFFPDSALEELLRTIPECTDEYQPPDVSKDQHTRIILVKVLDRLFGLLVDRVLEVNTYREKELETPEVVGVNGNILGASSRGRARCGLSSI
ncbi:hypothetical protein G7K71_03565 [Desulfofundulus sp. TPOSR]|uniref:chemotaxis protein CheW n=1 Tax=Desulfofundulus sp. TPOSR TaxID=2714340 RepID=UPI00140CC9D7|nr:chemotaxis protein CheW [Desulfofundulus sp. TPOSR]NHM26101.1 hypothetical protein [Desulfofundulus sp. TPOSR]